MTIGTVEAARLLNLSPRRIAQLCAEGKIQASKIGKTWVITSIKENEREQTK